MKKYRILALEGGGSWSIIQAIVLKDIFGGKTKGIEVLKHFDMVTANSAGSIVLGGLLENKTLDDIMLLFNSKKTRETIFQKLTLKDIFTNSENFGRILSIFSGIGPIYSTEKKLEGFRKLFTKVGRKMLHNIPQAIGLPKLQIIIVAYDYRKNRVKFFRSNPNSKCHMGDFKTTTLSQAIHASTNAPVNYFNHPAKVKYNNEANNTYFFWDGSVSGFGNPNVVGVIEAITNLDMKKYCLKILSLGTFMQKKPTPSQEQHKLLKTTTKPFYYIAPPEKFKLFEDILKLSRSIFQEPPKSANYISKIILDCLNSFTEGNQNELVRICPVISPIYIKEKNMFTHIENFTEQEFKTLLELDFDVIKQEDMQLVNRLGQLFVQEKSNIPNQCIRYKRDLETNKIEFIGHLNYHSAKKTWLESMN